MDGQLLGLFIFHMLDLFDMFDVFFKEIKCDNESSVVKMALGVAPAKEEIYAKMGLGSDKKVAEGLVLEMASILFVLFLFSL